MRKLNIIARTLNLLWSHGKKNDANNQPSAGIAEFKPIKLLEIPIFSIDIESNGKDIPYPIVETKTHNKTKPKLALDTFLNII
jgi:hypothetical protein